MSVSKKGSWGLRLLALVLAVVLYHVLKNESLKNFEKNDRTVQHAR